MNDGYPVSLPLSPRGKSGRNIIKALITYTIGCLPIIVQDTIGIVQAVSINGKSRASVRPTYEAFFYREDGS